MSASLKSRIKNGDVTIGGWLQIPSIELAEALASCGFDWVAIDMEHGSSAFPDLTAIFSVMERRGVTPLVRLPSADPYFARRLLDAGCAGLIVPVVEDPEAFQDFISHCLYPPHGRRGVGLSRANLWGDTFDENFNDFAPVIIPQIETLKGVDNTADIAANPNVDAMFIGPYDLSANLGVPGVFDSDDFLAAKEKVRAATLAADIALAGHQVKPDPASLQEMIDDGFKFIAYGTDVIGMRSTFTFLQTFDR